jgi:hypothetical protein
VIVVVGLVGVVIVAMPGLLTTAVHVPVPVAAIVAVPPGRTTQLTVWSGPASGLVVTITSAESAHVPLVQIKI